MDASPVVAGLMVCAGAVLALNMVGAVMSAPQERKRQDALRQWTLRRRWRSGLPTPAQWSQRMPGKNRHGVTLAVSGTIDGRLVTIAEYQYRHSKKSHSTMGTTTTISSTYRYVLTVVRLREPGPTIAVYRRGAMSHFGRFLVSGHPTTVGRESFDRIYRVNAEDPDQVRLPLGPELIAAHESGEPPGWSLVGLDLLSFPESRIDDPATILTQVSPLVWVADQLERSAPHQPIQ